MKLWGTRVKLWGTSEVVSHNLRIRTARMKHDKEIEEDNLKKKAKNDNIEKKLNHHVPKAQVITRP